MSGPLLSMVAAAILATHATPTMPTAADKNTATALTLTGCINRDAATPGSDAFSDAAVSTQRSSTGGRIPASGGKWPWGLVPGASPFVVVSCPRPTWPPRRARWTR